MNALLVAIVAIVPGFSAVQEQPKADIPDALNAVRRDEAQRVSTLEQAARSVVCIFGERTRSGGGSGVIIDPAGYGLTNFHVVQGFLETRRGFGGLSDGKLYPLRVLGVDAGGDVVMFKLEGRERFDAAPLGDSAALRVGDQVAAIGNPFLLADDYAATITLGIVSGLHRYQEGQNNLLEYADCIQVSTSINPGNSGGPLFTLDGRVVGINGRISGEERVRVNVGLGYAISINQIKRFMPALRAGRWCEHGTLGVTVRAVRDGVIIDAIQALSPAERAGLELRDRIVAVAGRKVHTPNEYNNIIATLPADWPVQIEYERDDRTGTVEARLERVLLRVDSPWLVDLPQNHAELKAAVERFQARAETTPLRDASSLEWRGQSHSGREQAQEFAFETSLRVADSASRPTSASAASAPASKPATAAPTAGGESWQTEWSRILMPLLRLPELDAHWELLAGDEVHGRICNVIERREDDGARVRWALDYETDELRAAWIGNDDDPRAIRWEAGEAADLGVLRFPRVWTRIQETPGIVVELSGASIRQ